MAGTGRRARIDQPWQAHALAVSCDRTDPSCLVAERRFQQLDPDNALAWVIGLPDASPGEQGDRAMLRAAQATRIDRHEAELLDAAIAFASRILPGLSAQARITPPRFALEIWNRIGIVRYGVYCRRAVTAHDDPTVESACLSLVTKVGPAMKPRISDEMAAASMIVSFSADPAERARASHRYRDARWVFSAWKQLPAGSEHDDDAHLRALRDNGELAYVQLLVAAAHLPLDAPAEFVTREPLPMQRQASVATK
jgi:hypothetical protein